MIKVLIGDIFESEMKTLVNTVNCVGVMGKGIAKVVKKKHPMMFEDYVYRCKMNQVRLGEPYHYSDLSGISIVNFPTKEHWRTVTRLSDIENGLDYFVEHVHAWNIESVAFPPLGCGNGGLEWTKVGPIMYSKLKNLSITVELYAPFGTPVRQLKEEFLDTEQQIDFLAKGRTREKLRPEWAVLVEILYELERQPYTNPIGRGIFHKICYIMTKLGLDTGFRFGRGSRGYFSDGVQEAINVLANNNWITEKQCGRMTTLKIGPCYIEDRRNLRSKIIPFIGKIDKTVDLFSRIRNNDQAEEVATAILGIHNLRQIDRTGDVTELDLFHYALTLKKAWKNDEKKKAKLAETIRNLAILGWVKLRLHESFDQSVVSDLGIADEPTEVRISGVSGIPS